MDTDLDLLAGLQAGDERAFVALVGRYHTRLIRLAMTFVDRAESAEDVAQETWLAVVRGIDRFEGRSQLQPWLFQICVNRARTLAGREHRMPQVDDESAIERFDQAGRWVEPPLEWVLDDVPDTGELVQLAHAAIEQLPASQRQVVTLRDVEGLSSEETCRILGLSAGNQRVLLHRGRAGIRRLLDGKVAHR